MAIVLAPSGFCSLRRGGYIVFAFSLLLVIASYDDLRIWPWLSSYPSLSAQDRLSRDMHQKWRPPHDWLGTDPIYDNFPGLNDKYAFGADSLARRSWFNPLRTQAFPEYRTLHTEQSSPGIVVPCYGSRGERLSRGTKDSVWRHVGDIRSFVRPSFGSALLVGFEHNVYYDRYGRFGAYGLTRDRESGSLVDWHNVDWGSLQEMCYHDNQHRFDLTKHNSASNGSSVGDNLHFKQPKLVQRTAVVIRCHQNIEWTRDIKRNIRAIVQELALYASAEYAVFLLVEIKDRDIPIWRDSSAYNWAMRSVVPREFRNISVLWSMYQWHAQYPLIPEDLLGVHLSQWLPLQYFQKLYPEFSFFWNWEMDVRYTGHHYDLVSAVDNFTQSQPMKGLWERNARFYIPQKHGSYSEFRNSVQQRYLHDGNDSSIWGPHFPVNHPTDAQASWFSCLNTTAPKSTPAQDDFEWGVGEQADFVTFLPMFNPDPTNYVYRDTFTNYETIAHSSDVPRRTTIITLARISSRLLQLMELENITPPMHHMSSESWPHSVSLHYGLKAVTVPHAIYMEQDWPVEALDFIFNNGDQQRSTSNLSKQDQIGEGSGGPESTFGLDREHNWERSSWYYRNRFAERLYKRWLGWEVDAVGGQKWEKSNGEYCLPPMLLHPIKVVKDPEYIS